MQRPLFLGATDRQHRHELIAITFTMHRVRMHPNHARPHRPHVHARGPAPPQASTSTVLTDQSTLAIEGEEVRAHRNHVRITHLGHRHPLP